MSCVSSASSNSSSSCRVISREHRYCLILGSHTFFCRSHASSLSLSVAAILCCHFQLSVVTVFGLSTSSNVQGSRFSERYKHESDETTAILINGQRKHIQQTTQEKQRSIDTCIWTESFILSCLLLFAHLLSFDEGRVNEVHREPDPEAEISRHPRHVLPPHRKSTLDLLTRHQIHHALPNALSRQQ